MAEIGYYCLKGLLSAVAALPLKLHYFNARLLSLIARKFYRTNVVRDNLEKCFPQKSAQEREVILKKFYDHFADLVVEAIWFGGCSPKRLKKQGIVSVGNVELLNEVYDRSESVMVIFSHMGNWELIGGTESYSPVGRDFHMTENDFVVVYKKLTSKVWDKIMNENRKAPLVDPAGFEGLVETQSLIRYVLSHRGQKKVYNINTDQRPYASAKGSLPVEFMHRECRSMAAAANLAAKFAFPVMYQRMLIVSRGHYKIEYELICEDASKMPVEEIMQKFYDLLTRDIESQPENYLWTHRRWA